MTHHKYLNEISIMISEMSNGNIWTSVIIDKEDTKYFRSICKYYFRLTSNTKYGNELITSDYLPLTLDILENSSNVCFFSEINEFGEEDYYSISVDGNDYF